VIHLIIDDNLEKSWIHQKLARAIYVPNHAVKDVLREIKLSTCSKADDSRGNGTTELVPCSPLCTYTLNKCMYQELPLGREECLVKCQLRRRDSQAQKKGQEVREEEEVKVDVETKEEVADIDVELQGRITQEDVSAATKDVNDAEPTVFDDEEVTITMAQTLIKMKAKKARLLDEQMAQRLHDEEKVLVILSAKDIILNDFIPISHVMTKFFFKNFVRKDGLSSCYD
nr:hypothetical protein [Tanacetum cinerariifolium]